MVRTSTATAYLFGTVHVLKPGVTWETPVVKDALARSQELWMEVPNLTDTSAALSVAQAMGSGGGSLAAQLSPQELAKLSKVAGALGLPGGEQMLDPLAPWAAALLLDSLFLAGSGYDPSSGADYQLYEQFTAAGKPVRGFETFDQQANLLAGLPVPQQIAFLDETVDECAQGPAFYDHAVAAWQAGDVNVLAALDNPGQAHQAELLYRRLVVDRNARWARILAGRLQQGGTIFVAVGAGHLAGPASLLEDLTALGYQVQRIQ
jgi:uncharacterized protein YbaP (TraB family)